MKNNGIGTKILSAVIALGVVAYFTIQVYNYYDDPLTTTMAYAYEVETGVSLSGYVVRDEQVLTDQTGGLLRLERSEGERVGTGGLVALVYADQSSLDRQEEIDTLESRLEQLEYAQEASMGSEVSKKLDTQIMQSLLEFRSAVTSDRLDKAETQGSTLRSLVLKRDYTYSDTEDLSAEIADLESQISALNAQSASSVRRITAPVSGLYSAVVDGYEQVLTPDSLSELLPSTLNAVQADTSVSGEAGKLVLGDAWYYAAIMNEADASALEGQTLTLRFSKSVDRDLSVKLSSVSEAENGQVVAVFTGRTYLQELTLLRQQSAEIISGTVEGIRVPKEALRVRTKTTENKDGTETTTEESGVYCVVGLEARFKPVEVLYRGDDFVLVKATSSVEKTRLRSGDEVIITAKDLYDGKVVGTQ